METLASCIKRTADIIENSNIGYWISRIKELYNIDAVLYPGVTDGHIIFRHIYNILQPIPPALIKDCGIKRLGIRADMGLNKPYYPNHGYFDMRDEVVLNADIFYHPDVPDDFFDFRGYFITRPQQTLLHEFSHAFDWANGNLSYKDGWTKLSGWSPKYKKGLKRLIINDKRAPKVVGEWFYDPKAEFTRFYAKRNPCDDWADSSAFYLGKLRSKVPSKKLVYFDNIYKKYYNSNNILG